MTPFAGMASWLVLLLLTNRAVSVSSPQSIRSDLSILTHNDLYGWYQLAHPSLDGIAFAARGRPRVPGCTRTFCN